MESENLKKYREMTAELSHLRNEIGLAPDSKEIDDHLDKMDVVWYSLSEEDIDTLNKDQRLLCDSVTMDPRICATCKWDGNAELVEYASMSRSLSWTNKGWVCSQCPGESK